MLFFELGSVIWKLRWVPVIKSQGCLKNPIKKKNCLKNKLKCRAQTKSRIWCRTEKNNNNKRPEKIYNIYIDICVCVWGQRAQQPRPTWYKAQGLCRGGRNARWWTKRVQIAKRHCRGQSCPQSTKVIRRKSGMPSKTTSQGIPRKKD